MADTPALFGQTVYPSFGKSGPAQLSAMPSVHVAWAVIIGVAIVLVSSSRWRWFFLAHPVVTMVVVVVTGNHYWLDGGVAAVIVLLAVVFERWARGLITRWLARALSHSLLVKLLRQRVNRPRELGVLLQLRLLLVKSWSAFACWNAA